MDSTSLRQERLVSAVLAPFARSGASSALDAGFRALFEAELRYVWTSLGRLGISDRDREDLASEVFFRVHRRIADWDRTRPVRPWLFAFVVRVASEHRKLARTHREQLGASEDVASLAVGTEPRGSEDRQLVQLGLLSLDLEKRAVFVMHFLDEFTIPEIARALEIPVGTAYSRLRAAREIFAATVRTVRKGER